MGATPGMSPTALRVAGLPAPVARNTFLLNLLNSTAHQDLGVQPHLRNIGRAGLKPVPEGYTRRHVWGYDKVASNA